MDCKLSATLFMFIENNDIDCYVALTNRKWECVNFFIKLRLLVQEKNASDQGSSPSQDKLLFSWARHLTLTVPLSTQVYIRCRSK